MLDFKKKAVSVVKAGVEIYKGCFNTKGQTQEITEHTETSNVLRENSF